jgi:hypothetical protein
MTLVRLLVEELVSNPLTTKLHQLAFVQPRTIIAHVVAEHQIMANRVV